MPKNEVFCINCVSMPKCKKEKEVEEFTPACENFVLRKYQWCKKEMAWRPIEVCRNRPYSRCKNCYISDI